jgi:transposase-like protein
MGFVDTKKGDAAGAAPGPGDRASIERALRECDGNVTRAARALGMHRNQLRRWLTKYGDQAQNLAPGGADDEPEEPEG